MKILDQFSYQIMMELLARMRWLIDNGFTLEDVEQECREDAEDAAQKESAALADDLEKIKAHPKSRLLPWCPECKDLLRPVESQKDECETELICPCGHRECLDISMTEYELQLNATMEGKEVDFDPREIRETIDERLRRREICKECPYLNGTRCVRCGCSVKHRSYYKILNCPEEKW